MQKETLKDLKETKEEKIVLKNRKRNYVNSTGSNNSSSFGISRSKYKPDIRQ